MNKTKIIALVVTLCVVMAGCSAQSNVITPTEEEITVSNTVDNIINADDMFTARDLDYDYSNRDSYEIRLSDSSSQSDSDGVAIKDDTITISTAGVYILSGSLSNGQIIVDAGDEDKVQLVLNAVNINCNSSAAIYCKNADKLFVTTTADSTLSNKSEFVTDDNNVNSVLFSKSDLTLNGSALLNINAVYGNSVLSKDDLVITSGEYELTAQNHTLKANDSIRVTSASLNLNAGKDALHCESDDDTKGFIYIENGDITINALDDGIQASSAVKVCDGNIDIQNSTEGIEGRFIDIAGGIINVISSDDGFNACDKSQETNADTEQENSQQGTPPAPPQDNRQAPPNMPSGDMPQPPADMPNNGEQPMNDGERPDDMPSDNAQMPQNNDFGKMESGSTDCSITISGGEITVNADGDGLDSNGIIKITGGNTVVYGAQDNGNSALDYQTQATITGGSVIAIGMSGMAQSFSNSSTQGAILYSLDTMGSANDTIELNYKGKSLLTTTAVKPYNCILVSCPELNTGKYTLVAGDNSYKIKADSAMYSNAASGDFSQQPRNGFDNKNPMPQAQ